MSESQKIIALALQAMVQLHRTIEAANTGDLVQARALLDAARTRYASALAEWDAAKPPA